MGTVWSLRGRAGFERVRTDGRSARGIRVSVKVVPVDDGLPVRLGMAVGRNVGGAVLRNVIRRRLRAIVAEVAEQLAGTLVVVRALPGVCDVSFIDLRSSVHRALAQVHPVRLP